VAAFGFETRREYIPVGLTVASMLVLQQHYIDGFSWPVSVQGKARLAANGHSPLQEV